MIDSLFGVSQETKSESGNIPFSNCNTQFSLKSISRHSNVLPFSVFTVLSSSFTTLYSNVFENEYERTNSIQFNICYYYYKINLNSLVIGSAWCIINGFYLWTATSVLIMISEYVVFKITRLCKYYDCESCLVCIACRILFEEPVWSVMGSIWKVECVNIIFCMSMMAG